MSRTQAEIIADEIRQSIIESKRMPGERLVEIALARQMGVSQNTIRDALHILERESWVKKIPRRGVYVYRPSPEEAAEIYALWAAIEELALQWAQVRMIQRHHIKLREHILMAQLHARTDHWQEAINSLYNFHRELLNIAGKPQTAQILATIHNRARLLENLQQRYLPPNREDLQERIDAYFIIVDAIDDDDIALAQQALYDAIMLNTGTILPILQSMR